MQLKDLQKHGYKVTTNGGTTEIYSNGNLTAAIFEKKAVTDNNLLNQGYVPVGRPWFRKMAFSAR